MSHSKKLLGVLLLLWNTLVLSCCSLTDSTTPGYIWQTRISTNGLIFSDIPVSDTKTKVIFGGEKNGQQILYCLDKSTGKILWEWMDFIQVRESVLSLNTYSYQNIFVFQTGYGTYSIDLQSGKTIKKQNTSGDSYIAGLQGIFFTSTEFTSIAQGKMIDGIISEILRFPPLNGYRIGVKSPLPFLSPTNDTMLVTVLAKVRLSDNFPQSSLILYNLTKRQFVYDTVDYSRQSSGFPVIANSKIYNDVGGGIQCNDLWTGKL